MRWSERSFSHPALFSRRAHFTSILRTPALRRSPFRRRIPLPDPCCPTACVRRTALGPCSVRASRSGRTEGALPTPWIAVAPPVRRLRASKRRGAPSSCAPSCRRPSAIGSSKPFSRPAIRQAPRSSSGFRVARSSIDSKRTTSRDLAKAGEAPAPSRSSPLPRRGGPPSPPFFENLATARGADSGRSERAKREHFVDVANPARRLDAHAGRALPPHQLHIVHRCTTGAESGGGLGPVRPDLAGDRAERGFFIRAEIAIFENHFDLSIAGMDRLRDGGQLRTNVVPIAAHDFAD